MADLQRDGSDPNDLSVDQFFNLEDYYREDAVKSQGTPYAGSQTLNDPRSSSRISRPEPYHEQVDSSEIATISQPYAGAFTINRVESLGGPSQPHTATGNEPLRHHEQPSDTGYPMADLDHIEEELEEVELRLKRRELQRRRQELLQNLPMGQQVQTSEHPQFQNSGTAVIPPIENRVGGPYIAPICTSTIDSLKIKNAGIESRYGVVSTNPLYFGFDNLSSNPHGTSSHLGVPDQSGRSDAGLLSLGSVDIPNSMPAPPADFGFSRQGEMHGPTLLFSSDQPSLQPLLAGPQGVQSPDPAQRVSILSSIQHDQPIQNPNISVIIRKRPRSPQPTKARRLSAVQHQLAKQTGVPEISLGVMCFNTDPRPKRSRTASQKQNKKDVQKVGGSCFLCLVNKKKCSGQRPCENCRNYWQKRVHDSTSFTWTCDVRSKLSDLNIFKYPLGISNSAIHDTLASKFDGVDDFLQKFAHLFGLTHQLEPLGPKVCLETVFDLSTDIHSIMRWERLLVFLIPKLQHDLAFWERLYRYNCSYIFDYCDQAHRSPHKDRAVMVVVLTFYEIQRLMETETLDAAVADHLQLALKDRLKIFCSRIFNFDESKEVTRDRGEILAARMVDCVPELSCCLPPHYRGRPWGSHLFLEYDIPLDPPAAPADLPSCLLRRSDSSGCCYDNTQNDSCCCGWTFDSAPSGLLNFFGHSAPSFARYVHSKPRQIGLEEVEVPFDPRQAMKSVFREPRIDSLSLSKKMLIFEQTMSFWLQRLFPLIHYFAGELELDKTKRVPEDLFDRPTNNFRRQVLAHSLRLAVIMYHDFWNSEKESETDVESSEELHLRYKLWETKMNTGGFLTFSSF